MNLSFSFECLKKSQIISLHTLSARFPINKIKLKLKEISMSWMDKWLNLALVTQLRLVTWSKMMMIANLQVWMSSINLHRYEYFCTFLENILTMLMVKTKSAIWKLPLWMKILYWIITDLSLEHLSLMVDKILFQSSLNWSS